MSWGLNSFQKPWEVFQLWQPLKAPTLPAQSAEGPLVKTTDSFSGNNHICVLTVHVLGEVLSLVTLFSLEQGLKGLILK